MEYVKLKTIAKFPTGKLNSNAAVENGKYPFFTCSHDIYKIDKYAYDGEYVLLGGNNAAGDFPIFYYNGKFEAYQRTYLIQPINRKKTNTRFLYYAIGLKLALMKGNAAGTATKFLTQPILSNIAIEKFDIIKQNKIVDLVSKYDDLIENNNKRIKILEQMAENLYKEWFIRFRFPGYESIDFKEQTPSGWVISTNQTDMKCPANWSYDKFAKIGSFVRGKNITAAEMVEGDIPVVSAGIEPSGYHNKHNVKGNSLTISASGANAGYLKYNLTDIWAADCSYFQDDKKLWFVYNALKFLQPVISNLQVGAAQPHVYPKNINKLCTIIPDDGTMEMYCEKVEPIYDQIKIFNKNNDNLIKQRDMLLHRLMSGKLEVN